MGIVETTLHGNSREQHCMGITGKNIGNNREQNGEVQNRIGRRMSIVSSGLTHSVSEDAMYIVKCCHSPHEVGMASGIHKASVCNCSIVI